MTDLHPDPVQPRHLALRGGELIGARYRLEGVAGAGGMATVWRAYDERLQRPVALKVISEALAADPAAVARFAREARTHARIQHPNLVQVYDYSVSGSQPYLVMEYVNGCTLSERLDRGAFSQAELDALATELLSALACVHDHGVLHRDIKTGNVLLDRDGRSRLTDFGLARLEDATQITRPNEVVGTLRFLAPELIEGRPASFQSDLYALGVLLRTVAGGKDQASPPLARLIDWLTERDPDARPGDAHTVLAALRNGRRHEPLKPSVSKPIPRQEPTRPLPVAEPTRDWSRSRYSTHTTSRGIGTRTIAVSALLLTVAALSLAVLSASTGNVGSPAPRSTGPAATQRALKSQGKAGRPGTVAVSFSHGATRGAHARDIDQGLSQLAEGVRRAAGP